MKSILAYSPSIKVQLGCLVQEQNYIILEISCVFCDQALLFWPYKEVMFLIVASLEVAVFYGSILPLLVLEDSFLICSMVFSWLWLWVSFLELVCQASKCLLFHVFSSICISLVLLSSIIFLSLNILLNISPLFIFSMKS